MHLEIALVFKQITNHTSSFNVTSKRLQIRTIALVMVLFQCHLPVPYVHTHIGMEAASLVSHLEKSHQIDNGADFSEHFHVHLLWLDGLHEDPNSDQSQQPSPASFEFADRNDENSDSDVEQFLAHLARLFVHDRVGAPEVSTDLMAMRLRPRNVSATFQAPGSWRALLQVHVA